MIYCFPSNIFFGNLLYSIHFFRKCCSWPLNWYSNVLASCNNQFENTALVSVIFDFMRYKNVFVSIFRDPTWYNIEYVEKLSATGVCVVLFSSLKVHVIQPYFYECFFLKHPFHLHELEVNKWSFCPVSKLSRSVRENVL